MNRSYVTFVGTDDQYVDLVVVLSRSLKKQKSIYPLVCIISAAISELSVAKLCNEKIIVHRITQELKLKKGVKSNIRNSVVFYKLYIWNLTKYDKLVFLDAGKLFSYVHKLDSKV